MQADAERKDGKKGSSLLFVILLLMIFTVLLVDFAWIVARSAENTRKNRERLEGLAAAESIHQALCERVSSRESAVIEMLRQEAEQEAEEHAEKEGGAECEEQGYTVFGSACSKEETPNWKTWRVETEIYVEFCGEKAVVSTNVWYGEYEYAFSSEVPLEK